MSEKTKKEQLKDLQRQQISGEAKTIKANASDVQIPEAEARLVHIQLVQKIYNPGTKEVDKASKTIALTVQEFVQYDKTGAFAGYDEQTILHDPRTKSEKKDAALSLGDATELETIRTQYEQLTGKKPGNKKAETLRDEIAEFEASK